jgi:predicted metal-dependent hydrolase
VSHKTAKIASLIHSHQGGEFDAHYLGFFECFNRQLFFEAHEVLEELWLAQRGKPNDLFYKGLIQLAGAFVHVQKKRREPAIALLKLAQVNLSRYPAHHESLDIGEVQNLIRGWLVRLETDAQFRHTLELGRWAILIAPHAPAPKQSADF